jgi:hypothetical protein
MQEVSFSSHLIINITHTLPCWSSHTIRPLIDYLPQQLNLSPGLSALKAQMHPPD